MKELFSISGFLVDVVSETAKTVIVSSSGFEQRVRKTEIDRDGQWYSSREKAIDANLQRRERFIDLRKDQLASAEAALAAFREKEGL